jgi:hypothetical protein
MTALKDARIVIVDDEGAMTLCAPENPDSSAPAGRILLNQDAWETAIKLIPFNLNDKPAWLVVQANRITAFHEGESKSIWTREWPGDSIQGDPQLDGSTMTVTLASGKIAKHSLSDGTLQETKSIPIPATNAREITEGTWLVPLIDGAVKMIK